MVCPANHERQFLDTPFYGVRQMTWHLQNEGHAVNEKRIRRLMRLMRLMPIYQKPNTSKPAKGHKTYLEAMLPLYHRFNEGPAIGQKTISDRVTHGVSIFFTTYGRVGDAVTKIIHVDDD